MNEMLMALALGSPLAALLAEAQLLELEPLAPEHLELLAKDGPALAPRLRHYGALFLGETVTPWMLGCGVVIVCDGTDEATRRIERVLWNDPATGVMRHADAGYEQAIAASRQHGLKLPMVG